MDNNTLTTLANSMLDGDPAPYVVGRTADLHQQFQKIRPEFCGSPEICFELAKTIIRIRRNLNLEHNLKRFFRILEFDTKLICESLSVRWLVSVCDTIADHGNEQQRKSAVCISTFVNLIKLAETQFLMMQPKQGALAQYQSDWPHDLNHGMTSYHVTGGDMPRNLFQRIDRSIASTPLLRAVFETIVQRFKSQPNLLTRLAEYNPDFWHCR